MVDGRQRRFSHDGTLERRTTRITCTMEIIDFYLYNNGTILREIHACDVITKRAQGERKQSTFSRFVIAQIGFSLFLSLSPSSLVHPLRFSPCTPFFRFTDRELHCDFMRGEPFGFPMIRRRWNPRVGIDFLLAVRDEPFKLFLF